MAGIVAAQRNGVDGIGVAPRAQILPIGLLGQVCVSSATAAVAVAIAGGADVINMSFRWGHSPSPRPSELDHHGQDTFEAVLRAAMMRDIVAVTSAGNCGDNTEWRNDEVKARGWKHNGCTQHNAYAYPKVYSGVIVVANTDSDGNRNDSSTFNESVGIAAPGTAIRSTVPAHECYFGFRTCTTADRTGTSMAAPIISGIVAHMKARFPKASVGEIRQALYTTAQNPDSGRTGHWTQEYGWGIVQPLDAITDLFLRFFPCDSLSVTGEGLVAYDIDVDIDADGDTEDDSSVELFDRRDVWVADHDGRDWCRVAHNAAHPAWSPDGENLGFAHRMPVPRRDPTTGKWMDEGQVDIWVMPAAGGPWSRVTDTAAEEYDLDWSGDGQIVYTANTGVGFEVWVVDASGGAPPRDLTGHIAGSQFQPSWSPDCTMIAYAGDNDGDNDIWVMNADGTGHRNLTTGSIRVGGRTLGDGKEEQPTFSPDGMRIAYVSDRAGGDLDIWVMNADGTGHRNLHDNKGQESKPAWSPHGDRIVFVHSPNISGSDDDIWTMDARNGQNWKLITSATANDLRFNAAAESNPAWSPRGVAHQPCQPLEPPVEENRRVMLSVGDDAQDQGGCTEGNAGCRWLQISLENFEPGSYLTECGHEGVSTPDVRYRPSVWASKENSMWPAARFCWFGFEGSQVYALVDGVRSNTITWSPPPTTGSPETDEAFAAVTAGWGHSCGLRANGTVTCWGYNIGGQTDAPGGTYSAVSAGGAHSCGVRTNTTISCWGWNAHGQTDPPAGTYTAVTAGGQHSCGLRTNGTITCWGWNAHGQTDAPAGSYTAVTTDRDHACGLRTDGTITCWGDDVWGQADPPGGTFTAVTTGWDHTCGLRTDGTITCWGKNTDGRADPPWGAFAAVDVGGQHSCALRTDGTITCWGAGTGAQIDPPGGTFTAITAGGVHSCGIQTDGGTTCWGSNSYGQIDPPPGGTFTAIAAGWDHSCGLGSDGTVTCWGGNWNGQANAPGGAFAAVTAGRDHSCGLRSDGTVTCWPLDTGKADPPVRTFTAIAAGWDHSCGLRTDESVACWGDDAYGQAASPAGTFTAIAVADWHSCGLRTNGTITCWGSNDVGQANAPGGTFGAVATGGSHSCGLRSDGSITCWGWNEQGQTDTPPGTFTAIAAGDWHSCGLRPDESVTCWGRNEQGQTDTPPGTFTAIAAGGVHSCGLRPDGSVTCWGTNAMRTAEPSG